MKILGVDPGLNTTGYGVLDIADRKFRLLEGGTIRPGTASQVLTQRLSTLYDGIIEVIDQFRPESMALEKLYSHYGHPATAILMGHARGIICLAAAHKGIPVYDYAATQIKSTLTGNGRATKQQMQRSVQAILKLKQIPQPHDVADALAVAICHYWSASSPVMTAVTGGASALASKPEAEGKRVHPK